MYAFKKWIAFIFVLAGTTNVVAGPQEIWTEFNRAIEQAQSGANRQNVAVAEQHCAALNTQITELRQRTMAHTTSLRSRLVLDELLARVQHELALAQAQAHIIANTQQPVTMWNFFRPDIDATAYEQIVQKLTGARSRFARIAATIEQAEGDRAQSQTANTLPTTHNATDRAAIKTANDNLLFIVLYNTLINPSERTQDTRAYMYGSPARTTAWAGDMTARAVGAMESIAQRAHTLSGHLEMASNTTNTQIASWGTWALQGVNSMAQSENGAGAAVGSFLQQNVVSHIVDPAYVAWTEHYINRPLMYVTGRGLDGWLDVYSHSRLATGVYAVTSWLRQTTGATAQRFTNAAARMRTWATRAQQQCRTCVSEIAHDFATIDVGQTPEHELVHGLLAVTRRRA